MEEEILVYPRTPNPNFGEVWDEELPNAQSLPAEKQKVYNLRGKGAAEVTCSVKVNGDYLKVSGALAEVVTGALKELAFFQSKNVEGKGKLGLNYTAVSRRERRTMKMRQRIEQKDKEDRNIKEPSKAVNRAFALIMLAAEASKVGATSYELWSGPVPANLQKVKPEVIKVDHDDNNNDNNAWELEDESDDSPYLKVVELNTNILQQERTKKELEEDEKASRVERKWHDEKLQVDEMEL